MAQSGSTARKPRNVHYYIVAEAAARAERSGQYEQAGKLWRRAIKLAQKDVNAGWSAYRAELCQNMTRNGWS